jgi:hypothetical protein
MWQRCCCQYCSKQFPDVHVALITDPFSAHQGGEDDDMNIYPRGQELGKVRVLERNAKFL